MDTTIKTLWPTHLRPREKLIEEGPSSLTDTELLAIFLRTGLPGLHVMQLAENLLSHFGSLHKLISAERNILCDTKGLGVATYAQLQAVGEMAHRYYCSRLMRENVMTSPIMARNYLQLLLARREREIFIVLFLDNRHHLICHRELFQGTVNSVEVHPREILREALKVNAAAVILAHNHPSGNAEPSRADREVTERVVKACLYLDIRVLDHLVIGAGDCVSFAERGWL
ncbi:RadC family protein [Biostraticola tofi]|uniref:UPF0758 protein EDC52_10966 n=1 Tax=Biostraticola tofi TaxID=466109 RepID=A0A4R3YMH6_9GAMM|nr:DNA repair protein RadC [Biostraticola tofi]TCV93510.1 DNA replication and repair protein RadC [Biostraticola tofi]